MHNITRGQVESGREAHFAGWTTAQTPAIFEKPRPGGPVDGSIYASPTEQRRVCGIYNGIDIKTRDVLNQDLDHLLETLLSLIVLGGVGWFWIESLRARETAVRACREFCAAHELQFLDATVSLSHFELCRSASGRFWGLGLRRVYEFEFSRVGTDRGCGSVTLTGGNVDAVFLPLFDDPQ